MVIAEWHPKKIEFEYPVAQLSIHVDALCFLYIYLFAHLTISRFLMFSHYLLRCYLVRNLNNYTAVIFPNYIRGVAVFDIQT